MSEDRQPDLQILLVEDDSFDARHFKRLLSRSGVPARCEVYATPHDALAHLAAAPPPRVDILFLDMNLPGMSGIEFLEACVTQFGVPLSCRVIPMLSVPLMASDEARLKTLLGDFQTLAKPFDQQELLQILR
ncbi:response regulator [Leisingera aquaemixtae]|uniref:response regulator n=1 Tax=Leisingera aquaemixtae TaxID=1396826 RepID=UPI001C989BE6|nr:response regulator [Leisingera aquaemixtae]MBY6068653.1 response regulator [Leisingera aquaemixtae]